MAQETIGNTTNDIQEGFTLLQINEESLPKYKDPYSFAEGFKICSMYLENDVLSNDTSSIKGSPDKNL